MDDLRSGIGPAVLFNIHRDKETQAMKPLGWYPWHDDPEKQKTAEEPDSPEKTARLLRALLTRKARDPDLS